MDLAELVRCGRATITVPEWGEVVGVSKNTAYDAARRGEVPGLLTLGRRLLVSVPATLAWLGVTPSVAEPVEVVDLDAHRKGQAA